MDRLVTVGQVCHILSSIITQRILERLLSLFPDFAAFWDGPDNYYRDDDGSFRICGVFSEFTFFFQQSYEQLSPSRLALLGVFVSECLEISDPDVGDAAATCFLENIADDPRYAGFKPYLTGEAVRFFSYWERT